MNCYYKMSEKETDYADRIGKLRLESAVTQMRQFVGHRVGDDLASSYVRGARAECAVYRWLGGKEKAKWHDYWVDPTPSQLMLPDILFEDKGLDIKLRPKGWTDFIVRRQTLNPAHFYVLVSDDDYPMIALHGVLSGSEVAQYRIGGRADVPGHVVNANENLRDCIWLKWGKRWLG